jgi:hypothetical protein
MTEVPSIAFTLDALRVGLAFRLDDSLWHLEDETFAEYPSAGDAVARRLDVENGHQEARESDQ